ncbi:IQ domain-containing protein E-like isoform X1 [Branchiostoma floridae]|uniref:IQ domain-containing protein E-like isoform X1 n=1 Tax=Branchiostoma floridae TaxID=7739 RepID=A0A9J7N9N4_BRAFL|nr:IQ domain-containing protein E-like isoform X1 [Branchiostoma floridae]
MPTAGRQGKSGKGQRTGAAKNPREQWIEAMRGRTGALTGCIRNGVDTGRPPSRNAATASSSQYLKSVMTGRTLSSYKEVPLTQKLPSGTPAYKPQEDMYDEIIDLKKTVVQQKTENDTLKSRVGRLEEANKAKEKQIEQLLDPTKSNALKAAVYNSKPDSTTMVNNQKQRILKLEQTIRERDNTISAMKDDMRATRLQELEMQADIYFQEMQRLQAAPQSSKERPPSKESSAKVKALNDTILRLTDANQRLQAENKGLRQDLDKAMDGDRKELLDKIKKLEQDRSAMGSQASLVSSKADDKKDNEDYKKERDKLKSTVHRLKEDRNFYRNQAQEKEKEVEDLNAEVARLREKLIKVKQERLAREREEREAKQQDSAARSIQKNWRGHRAREEGRQMRKRLAAERDEETQQEKERERKRREREEQERQEQDMAAAKIQKNWRKHKTSRQKEEELNQATELIQSSVRGHFTRQRQLGEEETETESEEASSSDMESAATRVQSSVRGHWARSDQLQDKERSPRRKSLDRDEAAMLIQSSVRGHWGRQGIMGKEVGSKSDMDTTTADDSSDEDDVVVSRPSSRPSSRPPSRPPSRPSSRGSLRSTASGDRLRDPPVPSRSSAGSRTSGSAADVRTASPSNDSDSDSDDVVMPTIRRPTPAPRRIMEVE